VGTSWCLLKDLGEYITGSNFFSGISPRCAAADGKTKRTLGPPLGAGWAP